MESKRPHVHINIRLLCASARFFFFFGFLNTWAKCVCHYREGLHKDPDKSQVCVRNRNRSCSDIVGLQLFPVSFHLSLTLTRSIASPACLPSITLCCCAIYIHANAPEFFLRIPVEVWPTFDRTLKSHRSNSEVASHSITLEEVQRMEALQQFSALRCIYPTSSACLINDLVLSTLLLKHKSSRCQI